MTSSDPHFYFYRPAEGHDLPRDPLKAIVAPRPIGWISSLSAPSATGEQIANLAPYSFFNMICDAPPLVAFASMGWKDTLANIQATGEFTCNLAIRSLVDRLNISAAMHAPEVDEFAAAGLDKAIGTAVSCPRVDASPAALECRLADIHRLRGAGGELAEGWLVIGEVVGVHIARHLLVDGRFDTAAADIIQRAGYGGDYAEVSRSALFTMPRPPKP